MSSVLHAEASRIGRRDRRIVALALIIVTAFAVGGTALVLSVTTKHQVSTIRQAGRCQAGDLDACRTAGVNIIRSCSPQIIARLPQHGQVEARAQCAEITVGIRQASAP